jgi:hypothetical protein
MPAARGQETTTNPARTTSATRARRSTSAMSTTSGTSRTSGTRGTGGMRGVKASGAAARTSGAVPGPTLYETLPPLRRAPLPAGLPRAWYEAHNRRLKAMRLAIALLDTGIYHPSSADNIRIRVTADRIGVRRPSDTTFRMVRALIR